MSKFTADKKKICFAKKYIPYPNKKNGIYIISKAQVNANYVNKPKTKSLEEWHKILGHLNETDIIKLSKIMNNMEVNDQNMSTVKDCETCIKAKATRFSFSNASKSEVKDIGEVLSLDLGFIR